MAKKVNSDQLLLQEQSDLGLHCLHMPFCQKFWCTKIRTFTILLFQTSCDKHLQWVFIKFVITKTYLYNFDPLKPHFYIVKLGFTGVYIIFPISAQNIDCGYLLEPPRRGGSNEYPQSMFWAEIRKISEFFYLKIFSF